MRIAQIAPIIERVPPKKYGGTERMIYALTEELVKRGHNVTLFATGDSLTSAKLVPVYPRALREDADKIDNLYGDNAWSMAHLRLAYQYQSQFDIIHDHTCQNNVAALTFAQHSHTPVVMPLHGQIDKPTYKILKKFQKPYIVSISKSQAPTVKGLNYVGNVYNGLSMRHYPFSAVHDGYLLFVGRVHIENSVEEKGLLNAIVVAKRLRMPLVIAAKLDTSVASDVRYFKQYITPHLSGSIQWLGEVDEPTRNALMSKAYCFLHPINWDEPFGLTLIEAMACGAPVVAFKRGSIPEIIVNGQTGFVVETVDEMVEAVKKIPKIDRYACRTHALAKFNARQMALGYEAIYRKILDQEKQNELSVAAPYTNRPVFPGMTPRLPLK